MHNLLTWKVNNYARRWTFLINFTLFAPYGTVNDEGTAVVPISSKRHATNDVVSNLHQSVMPKNTDLLTISGKGMLGGVPNARLRVMAVTETIPLGHMARTIVPFECNKVCDCVVWRWINETFIQFTISWCFKAVLQRRNGCVDVSKRLKWKCLVGGCGWMGSEHYYVD